MAARACNPSTGDVEAGGSEVQGQPGLHKTLSQKKKKVNNMKMLFHEKKN
jgi:hypothetical protein